jgi:glycosyltransferase involved in cell wall biosynthesis
VLVGKFRAAVARRRKRIFSAELSKRGPPETAATDSCVLVISHDAHLAGAQRLLLSLLGEWRRREPFPVKVICVQAGVLREEFERLYPTLVLADFGLSATRDAALLRFIDRPVRAIYSSTVVNGPLLEELRALGAPIVTHSHELQVAIERWASGAIMATTLANSDFILGGCDAVARNLHIRHQVPRERLAVVYDFIDLWNEEHRPTQEALADLRRELNLSGSDVVVFGCGTTDWRKGPDIFLEVGLRACKRQPQLMFVWIGGEESPVDYQKRISDEGLVGRIQFIGNRPLSRRYYYVGNIFALTSREDPCPLVALEAADASLPVVCFNGAGDIPKVLGDESGAVVPFGDVAAFAESVVQLASDESRRSKARRLQHSLASRSAITARWPRHWR